MPNNKYMQNITDQCLVEMLIFLSNGFKARGTQPEINKSGSGDYIYLAFAESPFKNARAR